MGGSDLVKIREQLGDDADKEYDYLFSENGLMAFKKGTQPIACSCFSPNGAMYAYAYSYDWCKGAEHHNPATPNSILIHAVFHTHVPL